MELQREDDINKFLSDSKDYKDKWFNLPILLDSDHITENILFKLKNNNQRQEYNNEPINYGSNLNRNLSEENNLFKKFFIFIKKL